MAVPLTEYLSTGTYDGFDVVQTGIVWCQQNITKRFPRFRFHWAPIYNKMYNPSGSLKVRDFRFPYADKTFDFVFLMSVFTHMPEGDVEHYFSEVARVLKPGGKSVVTWFLLNDVSTDLIKEKKSTLDFMFSFGRCLTIDQNVPESAVAFHEVDVNALYARYGIKLEKIEFGSWCGRSGYSSYQDVCIGSKI